MPNVICEGSFFTKGLLFCFRVTWRIDFHYRLVAGRKLVKYAISYVACVYICIVSVFIYLMYLLLPFCWFCHLSYCWHSSSFYSSLPYSCLFPFRLSRIHWSFDSADSRSSFIALSSHPLSQSAFFPVLPVVSFYFFRHYVLVTPLHAYTNFYM